MTAVQLPRRLPDREPERSDPPSEADWLRRAIRHCKHWGFGLLCPTRAPRDCVANASLRAFLVRPDGQDGISATANWLPQRLHHVPLGELRRRLEALEAKARKLA